MSDYLAGLRDRMAELPPAPVSVMVGVVVSVDPLVISLNGEETPAQRTSAFDLVAATLDVIGLTVLVALPDGQPVVTDVIMEG